MAADRLPDTAERTKREWLADYTAAAQREDWDECDRLLDERDYPTAPVSAAVSPAEPPECHICHRRRDEPGEIWCSAGHPLSPADTIRLWIEWLARNSDQKAQALADLDALLTVGERDKAEAEEWKAEAIRYKAQLSDALNAGERDRRQIAQLTEALEAFFAEFDGDVGLYAPTDETEATMRAAVLADKEDAATEDVGGGGSQTCVRESGTRDTDTSGTVAATSPSVRAAGEGDT